MKLHFTVELMPEKVPSFSERVSVDQSGKKYALILA